jgi:hypothetical protein
MADEAPITAALCPSWATGVGYMGVAAAVVLSNWGSAVSPTYHRGGQMTLASIAPGSLAAPLFMTSLWSTL